MHDSCLFKTPCPKEYAYINGKRIHISEFNDPFINTNNN